MIEEEDANAKSAGRKINQPHGLEIFGVWKGGCKSEGGVV